MADRLILERECEHGQMRPHGFAGATGMRNPCPGGARQELTVDYEAAAKAYRHVDEPHISAHVRKIVDAALGLTEEGT